MSVATSEYSTHMGARRDGLIGFRASAGERKAVEEMARKRFEETGDESVSGWLRALIRREAKAHGVAIVEPDEAQSLGQRAEGRGKSGRNGNQG